MFPRNFVFILCKMRQQESLECNTLIQCKNPRKRLKRLMNRMKKFKEFAGKGRPDLQTADKNTKNS